MRRCRVRKTVGTHAVHDPLAAIPLRIPGVEERLDDRGCLHLRRWEPLSPWRRRVARWLRYDYSRRIELDEWGTVFLSLVDGRRSLREIVEEMTRRSGRPRGEVERAVILFTRALMIRQFLALRVGGQGGWEPNDGTSCGRPGG